MRAAAAAAAVVTLCLGAVCMFARHPTALVVVGCERAERPLQLGGEVHVVTDCSPLPWHDVLMFDYVVFVGHTAEGPFTVGESSWISQFTEPMQRDHGVWLVGTAVLQEGDGMALASDVFALSTQGVMSIRAEGDVMMTGVTGGAVLAHVLSAGGRVSSVIQSVTSFDNEHFPALKDTHLFSRVETIFTKREMGPKRRRMSLRTRTGYSYYYYNNAGVEALTAPADDDTLWDDPVFVRMFVGIGGAILLCCCVIVLVFVVLNCRAQQRYNRKKERWLRYLETTSEYLSELESEDFDDESEDVVFVAAPPPPPQEFPVKALVRHHEGRTLKAMLLLSDTVEMLRDRLAERFEDLLELDYFLSRGSIEMRDLDATLGSYGVKAESEIVVRLNIKSAYPNEDVVITVSTLTGHHHDYDMLFGPDQPFHTALKVIEEHGEEVSELGGFMYKNKWVSEHDTPRDLRLDHFNKLYYCLDIEALEKASDKFRGERSYGETRAIFAGEDAFRQMLAQEQRENDKKQKRRRWLHKERHRLGRERQRKELLQQRKEEEKDKMRGRRRRRTKFDEPSEPTEYEYTYFEESSYSYDKVEGSSLDHDDEDTRFYQHGFREKHKTTRRTRVRRKKAKNKMDSSSDEHRGPREYVPGDFKPLHNVLGRGRRNIAQG